MTISNLIFRLWNFEASSSFYKFQNHLNKFYRHFLLFSMFEAPFICIHSSLSIWTFQIQSLFLKSFLHSRWLVLNLVFAFYYSFKNLISKTLCKSLRHINYVPNTSYNLSVVFYIFFQSYYFEVFDAVVDAFRTIKH